MQYLKRHGAVIALLLVIICGGFLRLYELGAESIWLDEWSSIYVAGEDIFSVARLAAENANHPPLYFILLHYWMALFGEGEAAMRLLSAVFGIAALGMTYLVGRMLFNRKTAIIASLLSAVSVYQLYYSQEVRSYSLLLLLSLLAYFFFIRILKGGRKYNYLVYFVSLLLLGLTHFYGLFTIAAQVFFFLLYWVKYRQRRKGLITAWVGTALSLMPPLLLLRERISNIASGGFWIPEPELRTIFESLGDFAGSAWLLLVFLALILWGFFSFEKVTGRWELRQPLNSLDSLSFMVKIDSFPEEFLLVCWLALTILIPFIESKLMTPIYLTRYMIGASPAFYLLVARGIAKIKPRQMAAAVLVLILVLITPNLYLYYAEDGKEDWRSVATLVGAEVAPDSDVALFCADYIQGPFSYYYHDELTWFGLATYVTDRSEVETFVDGAVAGQERAWLLLGQGGAESPLTTVFLERYGSDNILLENSYSGGIKVILYNIADTE